ncbi:MAG: NADH-quinone oxidoreductase subunit A [Ilumatobacteraceae bacterium]
MFAYPYAVAHESLGAFGFWEMFAFSAVFFVAFVYVVARGALAWDQSRRNCLLPM